MKISIVRTDKKKAVHLQVKPIEWLTERIKTDTKAEDIGKLRRYIADFGDPMPYELEHPVARVFPSVEMEKTGNGSLRVLAFNGLVTLHVGGLLRLEDIEAVKGAAKMLPMTQAALTGTDGKSVEILVKVKGDGNGDMSGMSEAEIDEFCKVAYDVAFGVYSGILPKAVERQVASARSCFPMTLDPAPYCNPQPTPLAVAFSPVAAAPGHIDEEEQREMDMKLYADYERMYERAAEQAHDDTDDVIASQRHDAYITELAARLCEMGVPEEEAFTHIRNHHKFNADYEEDTYRAIVSAVYTENKPQPQRDDADVSRATRRLISFLTTRYVFRHNTVMGYTEFRPNNTWIQDWKPCDEAAINGISIEARLAGLDVRDKDVRRYVRSNLIRQSNPVEDYLLKVARSWDGKTDHIAMLARTVPCNLSQWEQWFKKWFLYMVAQWLPNKQEYGNAVVPLLISSQGDGKTSFCRSILPKELRWGFQENLDVSEKRQTLQAMHNFLLINLDEFNSISPKLQEGFLKNVIQLPNVKMKRPYGKHVEEFKRYASFIATTNEQNALSDPTGSRRFICVNLTAPIDVSYTPNYEALYGQAYTLVTERRMQWWFTPEELKAIQEHNREYLAVPPAMMYFNEYYEPVESEAQGEWLSPTAIYESLRRIPGSGLKVNGAATFGRHLANLPGLKNDRVTKGRLYLVKKKKDLPT